MLGKIMGAVIGRQIDRRDGRDGLKGAVLGVAAERLVTRVPLGWVLVALVGLWKLLFGRRRLRSRR